MSHATNLATIRSYLRESYNWQDTRVVPKRGDLTFGNTLKKMPHAVVFYVDMRASRKVMQDTTVFVSAKVHKAFLQALVYCIENREGHFRSFNGDGALAFFVGGNAASRAVKAAFEFKAYVLQINKILDSLGTSIDYGVGIAQGEVYVVKSGKAGDDATKQDLVWIGLPVYIAVELSDLGRSPNNLWITYNIRNTLDKQNHLNVVKNKAGKSMWNQTRKKLTSAGDYDVRHTSYYTTLF